MKFYLFKTGKNENDLMKKQAVTAPVPHVFKP